MIRELLREAWAESPAKVVAALVGTPVAVWLAYVLLLVVLVLGEPAR